MISKFIMLVGLPASGKSTKAQNLAEECNAILFSSDALREELFGDVNHQDNNQELFVELHRRIKNCLKDGRSAIYDACNISYKRRMAFISELKNIPCEKICIVMATPYEECLKRNKERERNVPEYVIEKMYRTFDIPWDYEGWDDILVLYNGPEPCYGHPLNFYNQYKHFKQDNTHHTLTLGQHCMDTCAALNDTSKELKTAGLLHDCGKPFCKTFANSKGEVTEQAHYYNHEHVGSYCSLFYGDHYERTNPIYIATLIRWHMQPYFWEKDNNEKQHNKYRKLWGENLYEDIMKLHAADKAAH